MYLSLIHISYTLSTTGYTFSLTQCWMLNLNQPGEFAIPFTALPVNHSGAACNNLTPQSGITGTPVIDTSVTPPVMYVVSAHQTASMTYTYRLHAININSGTELTNGSSAPYDLSGVFHSPITATHQNQRPGPVSYTHLSGGIPFQPNNTGQASLTQWRTAPLWGLSNTLTKSGGLMHDNASTTISAAILRHGGEAAPVIANYQALDSTDSSNLLAFLNSL